MNLDQNDELNHQNSNGCSSGHNSMMQNFLAYQEGDEGINVGAPALNTINNILKQFDEDFDLDSLGQSQNSVAAMSDVGSIKPSEDNRQFTQLM